MIDEGEKFLKIVARLLDDLRHLGDLVGGDLNGEDRSVQRVVEVKDLLADRVDRVFRIVRQLPDLLGDYTEPFTRLSGSGGFDGGVQGQEVNLCCDILHHRKNTVDLLGLLNGLDVLSSRPQDALVNGVYRRGHRLYDVAALLGHGFPLARHGIHLRGDIGDLLGRDAELFDRGGDFVERGGLLVDHRGLLFRGLLNIDGSRGELVPRLL